jgi:hypothetical protein
MWSRTIVSRRQEVKKKRRKEEKKKRKGASCGEWLSTPSCVEKGW